MKIGMSLICCVLMLTVTIAVQAQNKKKPATSSDKKKPKIVKDEAVKTDTATKYDTPPDIEQLEDTRIDVVSNPLSFESFNIDTTSPPNDELTADIKKLLLVTKAEEADVKMAEFSIRQNLGDDTSAVMKEFVSRFISEMKNGEARSWLRNIYIKAYRSTFTQSDIKALIQFYQTPLGQNLLTKSPGLMQNVMSQSQNVGRYLGGKLMQDIINEQKQR